eukprot:CAMPEP_0201128538 /NCGR_PEP_ID=MMETSP0850-20130426/34016_1 /ASSEMBLY_ACC=CAM_ASM_000622 /TAXON_ID=183588 /ORGANISM="Pseudo-nitzschia fraudulenta, Strain WWA7" /LENGTH=520 /DNA_ID=CAMNT_0047397757 /DNA_START=116 /DNA_END=1678 /DNA_ORIENTATION=+
MDSIMGAVVGPTLIFYVTELGGSKEDYGRMLSVVSLSSMIMIPVYGNWVDSNGSKYTAPYMTSFGLGIVGYFIYFAAVLLPKGPIAIHTLMFARFIEGLSIAGRTLSYSWVASSIAHTEQRNVFTLLSIARTFGMVVGPLSNMLVSKIDTEFRVFGLTIPVNPNNSIGLIIIAALLPLIPLFLIFFIEPPTKEKESNKRRESEIPNGLNETKGIWYALTHFDILFPVFTMFVVVCNFMLIFTTISPVARNMGWDSVQISKVTSYGAGILALGMVISMVLSLKNVSDFAMLSFGIGSFFIGGASIYALWTEGVGYWAFTLPTYLMFFGYPFVGPANRSRYTKAIMSHKDLEGSKGIMMSLVNQAAAFAGFVAPTLIATHVLRGQADIAATSNKHELTVGALYVPIFSSIVFAGLIYHYFFIDLPARKESSDDDDGVSETTTLLPLRSKSARRSSQIEISDTFSRASQSYRRLSVECIGVPNFVETKFEQDLNNTILHDSEQWDELLKLGEIEDLKLDEIED